MLGFVKPCRRVISRSAHALRYGDGIMGSFCCCQVVSPRYLPLTLDLEHNPAHVRALRGRVIYVKRKTGFLLYLQVIPIASPHPPPHLPLFSTPSVSLFRTYFCISVRVCVSMYACMNVRASTYPLFSRHHHHHPPTPPPPPSLKKFSCACMHIITSHNIH